MAQTDKEKLIAELTEKVEELERSVEYYKKEAETGDGKHKSEAVQELFNFAKDKLPMRTRLNEKQIQSFAIIKANLAMLDPNEIRTWIEVYMEAVMEMLISLKGKGRDEGMGIFQLQHAEEEERRGPVI